MSTIGIFSAKGSPGVTTFAMALATCGRDQGAVLIEADAAGGDLALRFGTAQQPGLAQLAARVGQSPEERDLLDGLVHEPGAYGASEFAYVPAPIEPHAVGAALDVLAANPAILAQASRDRPVILDLGQLDHSRLRLVESCDVLALLVHGDPVSLGPACSAAWATQLDRPTGFVLVDTGPYKANEVAEVLALRCWGVIPVTRRPLQTRRAQRAVRALWADLTAAAMKSPPAPELAKASTR